MEYTLPNKFFDYLYSCKPMILSDLYVFREMVNRNKIGITVDMHNININKIGNKINELVNDDVLITKISDNMKRVRNEYTWEKQEKKLLELYEKLKYK